VHRSRDRLQERAISAAIRGQDSLIVMATGAGKSLCYQASLAGTRTREWRVTACRRDMPLQQICKYPGTSDRRFVSAQVPAMMNGPGLVVVISPLLSLMHDQVSALRARNITAATTSEPSSERLAFEGTARLLYTTPETALGRLKSRFSELHSRVGIRLLAIDEAHCVSEWGHDFRPEYQRLAELRAVLPGVPIMALTATATPRVQEEMVRNLQLGRAGGGHVSVVSTFDRPNLYYTSVERGTEEAEQVLRDLVSQSNSDEAEPSIVYVLTQKESEKIAEKLIHMGAQAERVGFYHAGLSDARRLQV
jgi:ATP-dependent DNA helicase RecQ